MSHSLNVTELDFDGLKANLIAFMKENPEFTDYNFEASGLSFFTDVLAYNTHYNAVLANYMANEMFLDSALKRTSVLSHAKSLGYRPRGYVAPRAKISLTITSVTGGTAPAQFILRRGTEFTSTVENQYYQFVTTKDYVSTLSAGQYVFPEIELVEGVFNTYVWKLSTNVTEKYVIPNVRTDVSTINMNVYTNVNSTDFSIWSHASSAINTTNLSKVFFTQETANQYVEFYFGNGSVGARPVNDSIIKIEYVSCNGAAANGAKLFSVSGNLAHDNGAIIAQNYLFTTTSEAINGADAESVEEIKYYASNHFSVQNRAVTSADFVSLIRAGFYNVADIKVFGGEEAIRKQYGSVFICIKPNSGSFLTLSEKDAIKTLLRNKTIMGTKLLFVDPEYINLKIASQVYYNIDKRGPGDNLEGIILDEIIRYSNINLNTFNSAFKFSKLITKIDQSHVSINSNITAISMYKTISPVLGVVKNYEINFYNKLKQIDSISSSLFYTIDSDLQVQLKNKDNIVVIGYYNSVGNFVVVKNVGTIDFVSGIINLNQLNILSFIGDEFQISVTPESVDIFSVENNIIRIKAEDVSIKTNVESNF